MVVDNIRSRGRRGSSLHDKPYRDVLLARHATVSQKRMEALTSQNALDETINEGSYQFYRNLPKTSLPHSNKKHIFDGLDTSFIDRDILKLPCSARRASNASHLLGRQHSTQVLASRSRDVGIRNQKGHHEPVFKISAKYRKFVETESNKTSDTFAFGRLPVLSQKCAEIPTNYNSFFSRVFEQKRLQLHPEFDENDEDPKLKSIAENPIVQCADDLKNKAETQTSYPSIETLIVHIGTVKRMMGKWNPPPPSKSKPRTSEPGGLMTSHSGTSLSGTLRSSLRYSRHKTASDIPSIISSDGASVLGFTRPKTTTWRSMMSTPASARSGHSTTQTASLGSGTLNPAARLSRIPAINIYQAP